MNLPTAWEKVDPIGNELDVGTPEDKWKEVAHPRHPREEVRRWVRGKRYVRICLVDDREGEEEYFALHAGLNKKPSVDKVLSDRLKTLEESIKEAIQTMREGGY